jgi:hypothetical protein
MMRSCLGGKKKASKPVLFVLVSNDSPVAREPDMRWACEIAHVLMGKFGFFENNHQFLRHCD